jgi:hypothetical protein
MSEQDKEIRITAICPLNCARELGIIIEKSFLAGFEYLPEEAGEKVGAHFINDWLITKTEKGFSFRYAKQGNEDE